MQAVPRQGLNMRPLVIYHGFCADGFTAAWAAWKALGDTAEYYGASHGDEPPDVRGRHVFLLDFAYKKPVMEKMVSEGGVLTLTVIDHHKSAAEDLELYTKPVSRPVSMTCDDFERLCQAAGWTPIRCHFDMQKSGAMLAWEYFHPGLKAPVLVEYVQDRDLWYKKLPNSEAVSLNVFSYEYTFENWEQLFWMSAEQLQSDGLAILRKHRKDMRELLDKDQIFVTLMGHRVPVMNVTYMMGSDIAAMLLDKYPDAPFAGYFSCTAKGKTFGLRSRDDRLDVSLIAKAMGGGGHRNASGFLVTPEQEAAGAVVWG